MDSIYAFDTSGLHAPGLSRYHSFPLQQCTQISATNYAKMRKTLTSIGRNSSGRDARRATSAHRKRWYTADPPYKSILTGTFGTAGGDVGVSGFDEFDKER